MKFVLKDLVTHVTPKTENILDLPNLSFVSFDFPHPVRTVLFIHYGSIKGQNQHQEIVGRLYSSENAKETNEKHIGKLFINVFGSGQDIKYEAYCEELIWNEDGSFDIVTNDDQVIHTTPHNDYENTDEAFDSDDSDDDEIDEVFVAANDEVIRAAKLFQKKKYVEAEEICLRLINNPDLNEIPFIVTYVSSLLVLILSAKLGDSFPQPGTKEYKDIKKYLHLTLENYDILDEELKHELMDQLQLPLKDWRKISALMAENKSLESLAPKQEETLGYHAKVLGRSFGGLILVILDIIFLLVAIFGKSIISFGLFVVTTYLLYKIIKKK